VEVPIIFLIDRKGLTDIGIDVQCSLCGFPSKESEQGSVDSRVQLEREGKLLSAGDVLRKKKCNIYVLESREHPKVKLRVFNQVPNVRKICFELEKKVQSWELPSTNRKGKKVTYCSFWRNYKENSSHSICNSKRGTSNKRKRMNKERKRRNTWLLCSTSGSLK
jgi:hypothetical protein